MILPNTKPDWSAFTLACMYADSGRHNAYNLMSCIKLYIRYDNNDKDNGNNSGKSNKDICK